MNRPGRGTLNLTENLQATVARQREEYQKAMQHELETLAINLSRSSSAVLAGLETDIRESLATIHNDLRTRVQAMDWEMGEIRDRPRRIILISALTAALTSVIFWTGPSLWTAWRLGGATIAVDPSGTYLILPENAQAGWTCGGTPCVKLEE